MFEREAFFHELTCSSFSDFVDNDAHYLLPLFAGLLIQLISRSVKIQLQSISLGFWISMDLRVSRLTGA